MSRLKRFTHSLLSSYAFLGANVFYTLASVPLALKFLSVAEFGLWALIVQVANFVWLIDLGMSSSISRILIDHKDERSNGRYGGAIKSGFLVGLAQAMIVLVIGLSLVWFMADWLRVPEGLAHSFLWLMIGQVLLTAATFGTRIFGQVLYAWQRIDVSNYTAIISLAVGFAGLWIGFLSGFGIFSLLAGAAVGSVCGVGINALACLKLGFWPKGGEWGRASREQFREFFNYGADVFLIGIGSQLILSSQTVLVSRQLGVEAAALWSVMTKMFTLVYQIISRVVSNAMPAFGEMQVRGELELLWRRYRTLFITLNVFAGVCAVLFAACNGPFVALWVQGKFSWSPMDNVLLAIWLVISTQQCCHNSLIMSLKEIGTLKYIFILEGLVFVGVVLAILPSAGITGMLACSVLATTLFTWLSGVWRIARLSKMGWKPLVWDWQKPLVLVLMVMVPVWLMIVWILSDASNWLRLLVNGCLLTTVGAWAAIRFAVSFDLIDEIAGKLPQPLQRASVILIGMIRRRQN
jgi:O-antigen/teichoic acid export membrane protein